MVSSYLGNGLRRFKPSGNRTVYLDEAGKTIVGTTESRYLNIKRVNKTKMNIIRVLPKAMQCFNCLRPSREEKLFIDGIEKYY